ncbi:MAG: TIGR04086 family membrane protein [Firmicutes bacterium]|jgi:putative membrane protein, TIGR04086 family|nr:TIGR04086 family membrane protein [Clostridia bacterium]MBS6463821.1 TIGR04086 family membrane protein [Bacillota bacterium]
MEERAQFWKMTGRGVSLAIIVCLAAVLIFALVIQFTGLPESVIMPVNQFIKVLAIFIGCFFSLRGSKGWLKGGLVGLIAGGLTFLLFALLGGFPSGLRILWDLLFCVGVGILSGIISVNLKKD